MAKKGGAKKGDKGKTDQVKKEGKKLSALYTISGDKIERKNRFCPKCGPGMFLGKHQNRLVCGNCKYVEMLTAKKEEAKKEETPSEEKKE